MLLRIPVFILQMLLLSIAAAAQNTVRWNFTAPVTENADSVFLRILDSSGKALFADSVALSGSKTNIPTAIVQPAKTPADINIFGSGDRVNIRLASSGTGEVTVSLLQIDGRLVCREKFKLTAGQNEFSFSPGKLTPGVYVVNLVSPEAGKSVKILATADGILTGGTPTNIYRDARLKNAGIAGWKYIVSHPKLLTDTILVPYSPIMNLEGTLLSRPTVLLNAIDVFSRKGEYGEARTLGQMKGIPNLDIRVGGIIVGKTDSYGKFSGRIDRTGESLVEVIDFSEKYCSKRYNVLLSPGTLAEVKDFRTDAVFMVENYVDNLGKKLVEALWQIGAYQYRINSNFTMSSFDEEILKEKGMWIDPIYKNGKHPNSLSDINKQINKFHVSGLPKLFESDSLNSYIFVHYDGTLAQGQTKLTHRQDGEGLYHKTRADIYYNKDRADMDQLNILYYLLEHELDRVYFAHLEFDHKQYVMWPDAISRVVTYGYSPENSPLEDKILGLVVNGPTHLQLHNNFLLNEDLNLPGYTGTKSANLNKSANIRQMEKIFSGADKVEFGKDKKGEFVTVTYLHKN